MIRHGRYARASQKLHGLRKSELESPWTVAGRGVAGVDALSFAFPAGADHCHCERRRHDPDATSFPGIRKTERRQVELGGAGRERPAAAIDYRYFYWQQHF